MIIAVDFDGTCVTDKYPNVGEDIGAVPVLKELVKDGHKLILCTMRSGKELEDAKVWLKKNEVELFGVNENPEQKNWTSSPKIYANVYIDDAALGCPLKRNNGKTYVDWIEVADFFGYNYAEICK